MLKNKITYLNKKINLLQVKLRNFENKDKKSENVILKNDNLINQTHNNNVNISILDATIREDKKINSEVSKKLENFNELFTKITSKFQEVGQVFSKLSPTLQADKKQLPKSTSRHTSFIAAIHSNNTSLSNNSATNSYKINKEIVFKIMPNQQKRSIYYKIENFNINIINKKLTDKKSFTEFSQDMKVLYNKYFKYTDSFLNETLRNSRKPSMHSFGSGDSQIAQYSRFNSTKEKINSRVQMVNFMNTSIYLKSVMKKSKWMKS